MKPFCPQCGSIRPDTDTSFDCTPCAHQGHSYRLVTSEEDRQARIQARDAFYVLHGFPPELRAELLARLEVPKGAEECDE